MQENSISIEQIEDIVKKLKLQIIEKENKIQELIQIINDEEE